MSGFFKLYFLVYFFLLALYSAELDWEINSEIGLEIKEFHKKEAYSDQKNTYSSFIKSEIFIDFKNDIEFLITEDKKLFRLLDGKVISNNNNKLMSFEFDKIDYDANEIQFENKVIKIFLNKI